MIHLKKHSPVEISLSGMFDKYGKYKTTEQDLKNAR